MIVSGLCLFWLVGMLTMSGPSGPKHRYLEVNAIDEEL